MSEDKPTWAFGWPDRVDERIADFESRIAILERRVLLLLDLTTSLSDFCKEVREAAEDDQ